MQKHAENRPTVPKEPDRAPSRGTSAPQSSASDGDDTGRVAYDDLFDTPALEDGENSPADVWGTPEADPDTIPPLRFTAFPPEKELYEAAFRAAYRYPDSIMLVMRGMRKGLKRGKEAAERRGESR